MFWPWENKQYFKKKLSRFFQASQETKYKISTLLHFEENWPSNEIIKEIKLRTEQLEIDIKNETVKTCHANTHNERETRGSGKLEGVN